MKHVKLLLLGALAGALVFSGCTTEKNANVTPVGNAAESSTNTDEGIGDEVDSIVEESTSEDEDTGSEEMPGVPDN